MARLLHILPHPGGGGEALVDVLENAGGGFEHRRLHLTGDRTPARAAIALAGGRRALARAVRDADVVHVMGDTSAMLTGRLLAPRPSVVETQGLHLLRRSAGVRGAVVRRAMSRAVARTAVTVCASEPEMRELREVCSPAGAARLRLVLNGIEMPEPIGAAEREDARRELGLPPNAFAVLYAGQLERRKRPAVAAEAVRTLGGGAVLLAAGEGPERQALERLGDPAVRVLGFRADVPRLLAAADAFVMPSEREGLSLAVLEAMGRGLPVVVSDGAGNPEAVGDAGIVFPLDDAPALAAALGRLAADPDLRSRLGAEGRERVRAHFLIERWLREMQAEFYRALAAEPVMAPGRDAASPSA